MPEILGMVVVPVARSRAGPMPARDIEAQHAGAGRWPHLPAHPACLWEPQRRICWSLCPAFPQRHPVHHPQLAWRICAVGLRHLGAQQLDLALCQRVLAGNPASASVARGEILEVHESQADQSSDQQMQCGEGSCQLTLPDAWTPKDVACQFQIYRLTMWDGRARVLVVGAAVAGASVGLD